MSKYLINHPSITPENFFLSTDNRKVKSLYIPYNGEIPQVLYDTPQSLKNKVFKDLDDVQFLSLHPHYHMYVDSFLQVQIHNVNLCATFIYRNSLTTFLGLNAITSIYGDVILFGSVSSLDEQNYDTDYSVPYEIVEQVSRYFDYKFVFNVK